MTYAWFYCERDDIYPFNSGIIEAKSKEEARGKIENMIIDAGAHGVFAIDIILVADDYVRLHSILYY